MHVLFVHHTAAHGGSRQSLLATVRGLTGRGFRVSVACTEPPGSLAGELGLAGAAEVLHAPLPVFHFSPVSHSPLWTRGGRRGLVRALRRTPDKHAVDGVRALTQRVRPDLVHLNSLVLAPAADALETLRVPYVWHVREPVSQGLLGIRAGYFRRLVRRAGSRMIYISEADRASLHGDQGLLLENFVDLDEWTPDHASDARAALGIDPEDFVVLYLGGPSRVKGPHVLVDALATLGSRVPRLLLLAPGLRPPDAPGAARALARGVVRRLRGGTYRDRLSLRLAEIGLADRTLTPPASSEVRRFYAAADVVVFPSVVPHFARPAVEAMAAERAFIGSRLPGVQQLVTDGRTGLLVEPANAGALAEAILRIAADERLKARLAREGRQEAELRFSASRQIPELMAHYARQLSTAPALLS